MVDFQWLGSSGNEFLNNKEGFPTNMIVQDFILLGQRSSFSWFQGIPNYVLWKSNQSLPTTKITAISSTFEKTGFRDYVKDIIGGAPVLQEYSD